MPCSLDVQVYLLRSVDWTLMWFLHSSFQLVCAAVQQITSKKFSTSPITDLPKIVNKTPASMIFADDTSILFAHSNLIYFNRNIHMVFATLNKWFRTNQLSLNYNKTDYVHFTTKRNISVNLKIGFNNNLITNSS